MQKSVEVMQSSFSDYLLLSAVSSSASLALILTYFLVFRCGNKALVKFLLNIH